MKRHCGRVGIYGVGTWADPHLTTLEVVTRLRLGVPTSTATVVEVVGLHDQVDLPILQEGTWIARC
jgi:hypothetical protein